MKKIKYVWNVYIKTGKNTFLNGTFSTKKSALSYKREASIGNIYFFKFIIKKEIIR